MMSSTRNKNFSNSVSRIYLENKNNSYKIIRKNCNNKRNTQNNNINNIHNLRNFGCNCNCHKCQKQNTLNKQNNNKIFINNNKKFLKNNSNPNLLSSQSKIIQEVFNLSNRKKKI